MVNVDRYRYPHNNFRLTHILGNTPVYELVREEQIIGLREVVIPSPAAIRTICYPERSCGSAYKADLSQMVADLIQTDNKVCKALSGALPQNTTFIRIHTGTGDYGLDITIPRYFPHLSTASELVVDSKRENVNGDWVTNPGRARGALAVGSPLTLITADIVATGASERRAFIEAFVTSIHPSLYREINHQLVFPRSGYTDRLNALEQSGVVGNIEKTKLIEGLFGLEGRLQQDAISSIDRWVGSDVHREWTADTTLVQRIKEIIMIAHGAEIAGPIAANCFPLFKAFFPEFKMHLLYPAGAFELATKNTRLPVKNDGIDILVQNGATLELMTYMLIHPKTWEHTCIVYYGSARSGRPFVKHPLDMLRAMFALYEAAELGLTKETHLKQRMPALIGTAGKNYEDFKREALKTFSATEEYKDRLDETIRRCHTAYNKFWRGDYVRESLSVSLQKRIISLCDTFEGHGAIFMAHELAGLHGVQIQLPESTIDAGMQRRISDAIGGKKQPVYREYLC